MESSPVNKIVCLVEVDQPTERRLLQNSMNVESEEEQTRDSTESPFKLLATSYQKVLNIIERYEISTVTKFLQVLDKRYDTSKSLLHWDSATGIPFIIAGYSRWYCQHSKSRDIVKKSNIENKPEKRKYNRTVESKKGFCRASIAVSHLIQFPQHQQNPSSLSRRKKVEVNKQILNSFRHHNNEIVQENVFQISFPTIEDHNGHAVGQDAGFYQPLDKRLISKINELVHDGVLSIKELKKKLEDYVINGLFQDMPPPAFSNRRFFPTDDNLRSHRKRAIMKNQDINCDLADVSSKSLNDESGKSSGDIFVIIENGGIV